jgi:hypothetical protein
MRDRAADELAEIVLGIRNEVQGSEERLFALLRRGIHVLLAKQVRNPSNIDQAANECLQAVASAIREGKLRDPNAVTSFAVTVTRQCAAGLTGGAEQVTKPRQSEGIELHGRALLRLSSTDREILERFYAQKEPEEEIRRDMGFTEIEFRLKKSRAKAKLTEEVERLKRPSGTGKLLEWFTSRSQKL